MGLDVLHGEVKLLERVHNVALLCKSIIAERRGSYPTIAVEVISDVVEASVI
jgi:hypothetical protein